MNVRMSRGLLSFLRHNTIALLALFVALGGSAYAAAALPSNSVGTKQLKKSAVTAAKVKKNAITGAKILESSLGKVPSATRADTATTATHAVSADSAVSASNADKLGGIGPGVFGTAARYSGVEFRPQDSGTTYAFFSGGAISRTGGPGLGWFAAPAHLPQGAAVTRLSFFFDNTGVGSAGYLFFNRYDLAGATKEVTYLESTSTPGVGSVSGTIATPEVIDNSRYAYVLVWGPPAGTNHLLGAQLDYTLP